MISLAAVKLYLRVEFDDDDTDIERMIAAASDHYRSIGVNMDADPLPPAVEQAVFMVVAHFYENRSAMSDFKRYALEIGADRLVAPYREFSL